MKKILTFLFITSAFQAHVSYARAATLDEATFLTGFGSITGMNSGGNIFSGKENNQAFYWSLSTGRVNLGLLPGGQSTSTAEGISADGRVIVGSAVDGSGFSVPVMWVNGAISSINLLSGGSYATAFDVSSDGSVIVGSGNSSLGQQGFRWENGVTTGLGIFNGGTYSYAAAVSGDGSIVVGAGDNGADIEPFRWENGVMTGLGFMAGAANYAEATNISQDGSVIIGSTYDAGYFYEQAFRWTQGGGYSGMDFLSHGKNTKAYGLTPDGSIIVGAARDVNNIYQAVIWNGTTIETVSSLLAAEGVDMTGWQLSAARDVSDDGNVVFGEASRNGTYKNYIANLSSGGLTTPQDLGASLNTVAQASQSAGAQAMQYAPQGIFAAQNISAISAPIKSGFAFRAPSDIAPAAGGDFETGLSVFMLGGYGAGANQDFDNDQWNGTFGLNAEIAQGLNIGAGVIGGKSRQDLDFEGKSNLDALGGIALLSFEPEENGFRLYATAYAADLKLEIRRGYENGAGLDSSLGEADGKSYGTAVKLGWEHELTYGLGAMPYVEGRYAKTKIDSYEEQGGAFAANFSKQENDYAASRVGIEFDYNVTENLEVMFRPAWGHRLSGDNGNFTADVSGLSQSLSSDAGDRNWAEATIGTKWEATDKTKFSAELTGRSGDTAEPAAAIMIGSTIKF